MNDSHTRRTRAIPRIVFTGTALVAGLAGVIVTPLLSSALHPSDLGVFATAVLVAQFLRVSVCLGLPASITVLYFRREDPSVRDHESRVLMGTAALTSLATSALALGTSPLWASIFLPRQPGLAAVEVVGLGLASGYAAAVWSLSRCAGRPWLFALVGLGTGTVAQLAGAVYVRRWGGGVSSLLGVTTLVALFCALVSVPLTGINWPRRRALSLILDAYRLGAPTVVNGLALVVLALGDRVVLRLFRNTTEAGKYQAIYVLSTAGLFVVNSLNVLWTPHVLAVTSDDQPAQLRKSTLAVFIVAAVSASIAMIAAPVVLLVVARAGYRPSSLVAAAVWIAPSALPFTFFTAAQIALLGLGRTGTLARNTLVAVVANVAINIAVDRSAGLNGAAAATLVTYSVLGVTTFWSLPIEWRSGWNFSHFAIAASPTIAAIGISTTVGLDHTGLAIRTIGAAGCLLLGFVIARRYGVLRRAMHPTEQVRIS